MRWNFIICLFLVSAVLAKPRPKRSLGYIKSLFTNKLFGSNKILFAQPVLMKNESYQLFTIPGINNILIKVSKKNKTSDKDDEVKPAKPKDAMIVKPEVAIIGSYLGTTTEKETLLAIEMLKSMLNSGVLNGRRDSSIQELVVPLIPQPPRLNYFEGQNMPLNVYEEGHVLVPIGTQQVTPVQAKYSYKQKGPNADMTYKSYDGKNVIVTRTEKEPPLPDYIKMRIAEMATIGANPYAVRQYGDPIPHYVNPGPMIPEYVQEPPYRIPQPLINDVAGYVGNNIYGGSMMVDRNPIFVPEPMPIGSHYVASNMQANRCKEKNAVRICPNENIQLKVNNYENIASKITDKPKQEYAVNNKAIYSNEGESKANAYNTAVNEFLKNYTVNGQFVSQYLYKQMNHHSRENYTNVRVGQAPQLAGIAVERNEKNFVFIPPKDENLPMLSGLNNQPGYGKVAGQNDKRSFISKFKSDDVNRMQYVPYLKRNVQSNTSDFKKHPIVVPEQVNAENRRLFSVEENAKTNEAVNKNKDFLNENSKRGDIPGATF